MPREKINYEDYDGTVLSYSRVSAYCHCPLKYKFRYVDKLEAPRNMNLMFGSLVHELLELYNKAAINGEEPNNQDIEDWLPDVWSNILAEGEREEDAETKAYGEQARLLVQTYLSDPDRPEVESAETLHVTEEPVLITDFDKYWLQGYIDGTIDFKPDRAKILDYKTSSRAWSEYKAPNEFQPDFYGLLLGVDEIDMFYEVLIKTKTPKIQRIVEHRTKRQIHRAIKLIRQFAKGIENEIFYPVKGNLCTPAYCEYYDQCQEW